MYQPVYQLFAARKKSADLDAGGYRLSRMIDRPRRIHQFSIYTAVSWRCFDSTRGDRSLEILKLEISTVVLVITESYLDI